MVQQPGEDGRGQGLGPEHLPPVQEALVGGQDGARFLIPPSEKPEKEMVDLPERGRIVDLIEDQKFGKRQHGQGALQTFFELSLPKLSQKVLKREEKTRYPASMALTPKEMPRYVLPTPGGPRKITFSGPVHERETGQFPDGLGVDGGWNEKSKVSRVFITGNRERANRKATPFW